MTQTEQRIVDYMQATRLAVLATLDEFGPVQRTIASFGNSGTTIYFATREETRKVKHIGERASVAVLLQQEGQDITSFVNVAIQGTATRLLDDKEIAEAVRVIAEHSPRFSERIASEGTLGQAFFRISPREVRLLDFSRGKGASAVSVFEVRAA